MKKRPDLAKSALMCLLCSLIIFFMGCQQEKKIATPEKPEFISEPTDPPKGFYLRYNIKMEEYRWCYDNGYCPAARYKNRQTAIKEAWEQYYFEDRMDDSNWKKVK